MPVFRAAAVPLGILAAVELVAYAPLSDLGRLRIWVAYGAVTCVLALGVTFLGPLAARVLRLSGSPGISTADATLGLCLALAVTAHLVEPAIQRAPWLLASASRGLRVGLAAAALVVASWLSARAATGRGIDVKALAAPLVAVLAIAIVVGATVKGMAASAASPGLAIGVAAAALGGVVLITLRAKRFRMTMLGVAVASALLAARATVPNPHEWMQLSKPPPPRRVGPPVLLLVLDTVRADALDLSPPERSETPNLSSLAQTSDVYTNVIANASWTVPGHASLFTGRTVAHHRTDVTSQRGLSPSLRSSIPTVHELLAARGYRTTCITANPLVDAATGLARGCQRYCSPGRLWQEVLLPWKLLGLVSSSPLASTQLRLEMTGINKYATAREIVDRALNELQGEPYSHLLFLNFMDAHTPTYPAVGQPLPPLSTRLRMRADLALRAFGVGDEMSMARRHRDTVLSYYRSRVRTLDAELGRLFSMLDSRGWLDEALIVVTSDHGEAFGENSSIESYFLHHSAYEPAVRIPLLVRRPGGRAGSTHDQPMQQADVLPIVLDIAGVPIPPGLSGALPGHPRSLPVVTEWYPPRHKEAFPVVSHSRVALYEDHFKYVLEGDGSEYLFDLDRSPYEEVDVLAQNSEIVPALRRQLLESTLLPLASAERSETDPAVLEQLRALGYVK